MLKRTAPALAATAIALTAVVAFAAPAHAAPWDGQDIDFGYGQWDIDADAFDMEDVYLLFPGGEIRTTDLWDGFGNTHVLSESLGLNSGVWCNNDADLDVEVEAETGDLVITCVAQDTGFVADGLTVTSELRVLEGSEVVRSLTTIANSGDTDAVIDEVIVRTDFGSADDLYDYDNQSDDVLVVPAPEGSDYAANLNSVDAKWAVNRDSNDAPGGFIIGNVGAEATSSWASLSNDIYYATIGPFTISAGEARSVVTFANWDPQSLLAGDFDQYGGFEALIAESADNVVASMVDFSALTGDLANGLDPAVPVVNWAPVADEVEEQPELAETGAADVAGLAVGALLMAALGALVVTRRRVTA